MDPTPSLISVLKQMGQLKWLEGSIMILFILEALGKGLFIIVGLYPLRSQCLLNLIIIDIIYLK